MPRNTFTEGWGTQKYSPSPEDSCICNILGGAPPIRAKKSGEVVKRSEILRDPGRRPAIPPEMMRIRKSLGRSPCDPETGAPPEGEELLPRVQGASGFLPGRSEHGAEVVFGQVVAVRRASSAAKSTRERWASTSSNGISHPVILMRLDLR